MSVSGLRTASRPILSRFVLEVAASLTTLVVGAVVLIGAHEFDRSWSEAGPGPGFFPTWIGLVIVAGSLATLAQAVLGRRRGEVALNAAQARRLLAFGLPIVAFVVLTRAVGIYAATILYLVGTMTLQGGYTLPKSLLLALGTMLGFYFVFELWFQVPLPKGPLEVWLGLY